MTTHFCPDHILKMFDDGRAPDEQKQRACALAIAWFKEMMPTFHPRDLIWLPNPDTGKLELWGKTDSLMQQ
jgi:hypothetical protein